MTGSGIDREVVVKVGVSGGEEFTVLSVTLLTLSKINVTTHLVCRLGSLEELGGEESSGSSGCFASVCITKSSTYEFDRLVLREMLLVDLYNPGFSGFVKSSG